MERIYPTHPQEQAPRRGRANGAAWGYTDCVAPPSDEHAVEQANEDFYRAFETLRVEAMDAIWAGRDDDLCIHPGRAALVGWSAIRESWRVIFEHSRPVRIRPVSVRVQIVGDMARVSCIERIETSTRAGGHAVVARVACTNLFVRTEVGWRLTLQHGSPIADGRFSSDEDEPVSRRDVN